jgi:hypothetical protein
MTARRGSLALMVTVEWQLLTLITVSFKRQSFKTIFAHCALFGKKPQSRRDNSLRPCCPFPFIARTLLCCQRPWFFCLPMLRKAGHVGPYASLTHLLILMTSLPHHFYYADCSIVLVLYCLSRLIQCYCLASLLFSSPIVLDHLLIVHPSLVEQLAQIV